MVCSLLEVKIYFQYITEQKLRQAAVVLILFLMQSKHMLHHAVVEDCMHEVEHISLHTNGNAFAAMLKTLVYWDALLCPIR